MEVCTALLEEELKLDRDMHFLQGDNKDALGRQLEQTGEQLWNLACCFARVGVGVWQLAFTCIQTIVI